MAINLWVVLVLGLGSPSPYEARQMVRQVKAYYAGYDINVRVRRFKVIKDPASPEYSYLRRSTERLYKYSGYAFNNKLLKRKRVIHFLTPRTIEGYMVGYADGVCSYSSYNSHIFSVGGGKPLIEIGGSISYSTAQQNNLAGLDRFGHSVVAIAHELGHDLGATHLDNETLMNPAPLHIYEPGRGYLPLDSVSLAQIKSCIVK